MTSLTISTVAIAILGCMLIRNFASDRIQRRVDGRRAASQLASPGHFIDDGRHLRVSLALTEWALHYESSDMQACLDLDWVQDVEYDDELANGRHIGDGNVLRLRCFGQAFEFILPRAVVREWRNALPPRRAAELGHLAPADDSRAVSGSELSRADDDGWPVPAVAGASGVLL